MMSWNSPCPQISGKESQTFRSTPSSLLEVNSTNSSFRSTAGFGVAFLGASFPFGFFRASMAFLSPFLGTSLGFKAAKFFKAFLLKRAPTSERSGCAPSGCSLVQLK